MFRNDQHKVRDTLLNNITRCPESAPEAPPGVELEVLPLDHAQRGDDENKKRKLILEKWTNFSGESVANKSDQWTYSTETEDAPSSKKQKINPGEECVVCLERPRTHGFLHADIIGRCS